MKNNHDVDCPKPFISPNPITTFNPVAIYPTIHKSAFISPLSCVIGDVEIKKNVFVAPLVSIRADEGTPFHIGRNTNIQDGAILHGLTNRFIIVDGNKYSIFISSEASITHGALVHGPCFIGKKVFVGFNSIVYDAIVENGVFIAYNAVVTNGVRVPKNRFVPPGANIDSQAKADALPLVPEDAIAFARAVQVVNQEFPASYSLLCGDSRCSCGVAYNSKRNEHSESESS